jgi:hypothetical protein
VLTSDWFVTAGGDGFHQAVDPSDPNTVYSESQDGGLVRFDRKSGLRVSIQPQEKRGEKPLRWYWDSPLIISPHNPKRIYFGGNILFRSDDRGDSWRAVSPDLTRQVDRNLLKVMGNVPKLDAIGRGQSTSFYGNIITLAESPKQEGLIYAGTDDGLIQVTEDGGKNWRKIESVPGVPVNTYVARVVASQHDPNVVYAVFDNHKNADFAPYVARSADRGVTWTAITGDLPKTQPTLCLAEDHLDPNLLFAGTEFGLYYTVDGGKKWTRLRGGVPTIPVRDLVIQRRENDLIIGTFGRGIFILDDYSALRLEPQTKDKDAAILPIHTAYAYVPYGGGTGSQGETLYAAPNPTAGVSIQFYLKEGVKTLKQKRQEVEAEAEKKGEPLLLPTVEQLRAEAAEDPAVVILTITNAKGDVVRRLTQPATAGFRRASWDMRGAGFTVTLPTPQAAPPGARSGRGGGGFGGGGGGGFQVMPGEYRVSLSKRVNGVVTELVKPVPFKIVQEGEENLTTAQRKAMLEYRDRVTKLQRSVTGTVELLDSLTLRVAAMKVAASDTPRATPKMRAEAVAIEGKLKQIDLALRGDNTASILVQPETPGLVSRIGQVTFSQLASPIPPTQTRLDVLKDAETELAELLPKLREVAKKDVPALEKELDAIGAPHTPGRIP